MQDIFDLRVEIFRDYTTKMQEINRTGLCVSDTVKLTKAIPWIEGVDLLYHEATYGEVDLKRAKDNYHSTAKQAAEMAKAANVGQLVIGHFSNRYKDLQPLLEEAQSVFQNTSLAADGAEFVVK